MIGISSDSIAQETIRRDSVFIRFSFQDGGNNLGSADSLNCFVVDTRVDGTESYRIPAIPALDDRGVEGEVTLLWLSTCCVYPDGNNCAPSSRFPYDEVVLDLYIVDNDGNRSNTISTPPITLICDPNRL